MNKKEYKKIVEKNIEKESPTKNVLIAFVTSPTFSVYTQFINSIL